MKLNKLLVLALPLVMGLTSCGGEAADSKPAAGSSQTPTSKPTSKPASSTTSVSKAPVKTFTVDSLDMEQANDGKAYLVAGGTMKNIDAADQKIAFGLVHVEQTDIDDGTGGWAYGKATPEAADYNVTPVVDAATGAWTAKLEMSAITTMTKGAYHVYLGAKGFYEDITEQMKATTSAADDSALGGTKATAGTLKYYFRGDINSLIADQLAPVVLNEVLFEEVDGKAYVLIGGDLRTGVTEAVFTAYAPYFNLQCNGNSGCVGYQTASGKASNWSNTRIDTTEGAVSCIVRGTKGYMRADISEVKVGGFNTHLNFYEKKSADAKMDGAIDTTATPVTIGTKKYSAWCDPTAAANDGNSYWGNLAVIIAPADAA